MSIIITVKFSYSRCIASIWIDQILCGPTITDIRVNSAKRDMLDSFTTLIFISL